MEGIWQFIVGLVILAAIVGIPGYFFLFSHKDMRSRVAAGRSALGALWDIALVRLGAAVIAVLTFAIIVGFVFPTLRSEGEKYKGKTEGGDIVIMAVNDPQKLPGLIQQYGKAALGGSNQDPWASNAAAPAVQQPAPAAAPAAVQPVSYPDIPVFVTITFGDGIKRDVCAVKADSTGTYNIAVLCNAYDKVSNQTMSLVGADLSPISGLLPATPTPIPTAAAVQQQPAVASPLIFEQNQAAAQCFWAELLRRKSELERFGTQLLPAGSAWVLESQNSATWNSLKNEQYKLCSVKWGNCLQIDGVAAEKLNGRSTDPFYGEGSFPQQCVPTNP